MKTSLTLLLLITTIGCGAPGPLEIGAAGGTVTSGDGKLTLVIPPGALAAPVQIALRRKTGGFTPDPQLLAGSTYSLDTIAVSLAVPAQLSYALGAVPTITTSSLRTQSVGSSYGNCTPTTSICYVILGSGSCAPDHPKFLDLESRCDIGHCPGDDQWVIACGLPDPPVPELTLLDPALLLGGLYDVSSGQVSVAISTLSPSTIGLLLDKNTLTISSDTTTIHASDSFHLSAVQMGNAAIAKVQYYDLGGYSTDANGTPNGIVNTLTLVGESTVPPYTVTVLQPSLGPGLYTFGARALGPNGLDANGNGVAADAINITVLPAASPLPTPSPTPGPLAVTLTASTTSITAAGSTTLTATVSGGSGTVTKIEFFEGATKLGEATTSPFTFDVAYTAANNGNHTYFAQVTDSAAATATSNSLTVNVAIPVAPAFDLYADPVNGMDTYPGTLAMPFRTLAHAGAMATSGQTIGLLDGLFLEGTTLGTCDGRAVTVPGGLTFKSVNPRGASIGNVSFGVSSGSLSVIDVTMDGGAANGGCTGIVDSSSTPGATLTITGVKFNNGAHVVLSGSVKATVTPGSLVGSTVTGLTAGFAGLTGSVELLIQGALFDGGPTSASCYGSLFTAQNTSKLSLDGVTVQNFTGNVITTAQSANIVLTNNTLLDHVAYVNNCASVIVLASDGGGGLTVQNSIIQNSLGSAISLRNGGLSTVSLTNCTITQTARAIGYNISEGSNLNLTVTGSTITQNTQNGVYLWGVNSTLNVMVQSSIITGNADGFSFYTGTGSSITLTGNTIQNTGAGITLDGLATLTATAHGNTWHPSVQLADSTGKYMDGSTLVTSANPAGTNYKIVNGSTLDL